jgi:plastocyanin
MLAMLLLTPALMTTVVEVSIVNRSFSPNSVHVLPGDTVRWTQMDATQHTSSGNGTDIWYSGALSQTKTFVRVFNSPGTFVYRCAYHSFMTGEVIVGTGGPTAIYRSPEAMPDGENGSRILRDVRGRAAPARKLAPTFVKP